MADQVTETSQKQADASSTAGQGASLLDELVEATRVKPTDEAFAITRRGLQAFIADLLEPQRSAEKVSQASVDRMIAELDRRLCRQVDAILHHPEVQKLESAWRSLKFLVDRTDFRENNRIEIISASKQELLEDFEDAPEITKSGLYKTVYSAEFGQFGGHPYGAIIANYEFGPGAQDIKLLQNAASVGAMAHAPFIGAASTDFFGIKDFGELPNLKDLASIFEMPQYAKWNSFRESDDSRFVGLAMPHFLLRLPYGSDTVPAKKFEYREDVSQSTQSFLWGNAPLRSQAA
jgi:type VI secretion system protein ImpC